MVEIIRRTRKPSILTPSWIPCLRSLPTVNITQGCALGCIYCYIQGYPNYPGHNRIVLYDNTASVIEEELRQCRVKPSRVYFSASSDAFQGLPEIDAVSLETMHVLLEAGVQVAFLSKGFVSGRFIELFRKAPEMVFAQIGLTTLDSALYRKLEPRAAPPKARLESIEALIDIGVATTARLDPLIPDLTDTKTAILPLLAALRKAGIRQAAVSYLFLRRQFAASASSVLNTLLPCNHDVSISWPKQRFLGGRSGARMIEEHERRRRFASLCAWGRETGICISPCLCKNPSLGPRTCGIAGPNISGGSNDKQLHLDLHE